MQITTLTWADIDRAINRVALHYQPSKMAGVYGIPTGGAVVAARMAAMFDIRLLDKPEIGCMVIDDLVDSGRTFDGPAYSHYFKIGLFRKPTTPEKYNAAETLEGWIKFPWERDECGGEDGVVRLLQTIGEDPKREGLVETPGRVIKALREMTSGYGDDPKAILSKTFDVTHDEMIVVRGIRFTSLCEHHMLPFNGTAVVGYLPGKRIVGLSKLARLVQCFARRLQVQERMTSQITKAIMSNLDAPGAGCILTAHHHCMGCRGVRQPDADMVTSSLLGVFRTDPLARSEFMALALAALRRG
jgi:GTP cyclohydrolase I